MKEQLKSMLTEDRYNHSLGVMNTAVKLAEKYGADREKAEIAGLLHDCAKNMSLSESLETAEKYSVPLSDMEKTSSALIHAPLGAFIAKNRFGIEDKDILSAIAAHTVAKENMSTLDKIIYLADMIEPNRNFPNVDEYRRLAFEDLDKAFLYALDRTIIFNVEKGVKLHPNTVLARNAMIK